MSLNIRPEEIVARAIASGSPGLLSSGPRWPRVPLGSLIEIVNGAPFPSRQFNKDGHGMPLIRIRDVGVNRPTTYFDGAFDKVHLVEAGDLLVGMDGDFRIARWCGPKALLNQRVCRLDIKTPELTAGWLEHILQGYLDAIWRQTSSVTVKHLSSRSIADIPLPLPPIYDQRRILDILEDHLSRLDAACDYLRSVLARVPAMRGAVYQTAISGGLVESSGGQRSRREEILASRAQACPSGMKRGRPDPIAPVAVEVPWPKEWPTMSLEELTDPIRTVSYGILKPGPNIDGGVPYVRVVNMRNDVLDIQGLHRTSTQIASAYSRATLMAGDVLISIRGTYGRVVEVPSELAGANITQDTARLAILPSMLPAFAALALRSPFIQNLLKRIARGVAVKGVNIGDLRAIPLPVPSLQEQSQIVVKVAELLSDLDAAHLSATAGLKRAAALRKSLLQAAFSGRLTGSSIGSEMVEELASV